MEIKIKNTAPNLLNTRLVYHPFGMLIESRKHLAFGGDYAFGFNGKMVDKEVKGEGNQQDYGMRIYDPRIAKFLSVDPIADEYPELTPYQFASNTPIFAIDLDGLEATAPPNTYYVLTEGFRQYFDAALNYFSFESENKITIEKDIVPEKKVGNTTFSSTTNYEYNFKAQVEGWDLFKPGAYSSPKSIPGPKISIKAEKDIYVEIKEKSVVGNLSKTNTQSISAATGEKTTSTSVKATIYTNSGLPISSEAKFENSNTKGRTNSFKTSAGTENANLYLKISKNTNGTNGGAVKKVIGSELKAETPKVYGTKISISTKNEIGTTR